ncbi:hypothetical protein F7725_012566 [Dissostichus mawsoni]|uniref:Uncharacterized protein n=1 Tax=Dissostichus mawsoni TaxID=36200 RepID=A0A7J5YMN6_DISMA|nr:hypothetical protein F7725_012566 [Dissostichus mawsoni]
MRKPEALSAARAAGFNPTVVNKWFEKYKDTIETLGERPTTSCQRAKPPSYSLTSDSHFAFLKEKGGKKKKDPKSTEEWLSCAVCFQWFHESCAEDNGVLDDDGSLTCKDCLFPDM